MKNNLIEAREEVLDSLENDFPGYVEVKELINFFYSISDPKTCRIRKMEKVAYPESIITSAIHSKANYIDNLLLNLEPETEAILSAPVKGATLYFGYDDASENKFEGKGWIYAGLVPAGIRDIDHGKGYEHGVQVEYPSGCIDLSKGMEKDIANLIEEFKNMYTAFKGSMSKEIVYDGYAGITEL